MDVRREYNYDLLRIISTIAVIGIHVTSTWVGAMTNENYFGELYQEGILVTCIYDVLTRFAVPCFIMLSGAFILADDRNRNFNFFYQKTFIKIGIPTMIFSLGYMLFYVILVVITTDRGTVFDRIVASSIQAIQSLLHGVPYYHMWYLYMMIGVYLFAPVLLLLKEQIGEKLFGRVSWIFLACASLGYLTSTSGLYWDVGFSFRYVSYFMVGYELRKIGNKKKNNLKGIMCIAASIVIGIIVIMMRYNQALQGVTDEELKYQLILPLCPWIVAFSVCLFAGFSHLEIKKNVSRLSSLTFFIYLFHAGVWDIMSRIVRKKGSGYDNQIMIPICIITVFLFSLLLAVIYETMQKRIGQRVQSRKVRKKLYKEMQSNQL
ncbi:MAG: acyltransferase [Lachnospiraceae bacterium]|nr:acyltransferase [Lachnospiraceae bacterium]